MNGNHGVKVREEMTQWIIKSNLGQAHSLVIGGRVLGADKWVVKSISSLGYNFFTGESCLQEKIGNNH